MFITLEGTEGAGKTTQVPGLVSFLEKRGYDCLVTREPGGTTAGRAIRQILLDPANHNLAPEAELLLYAADRAQHVDRVIRPALEAGRAVVCDRYCDATEAYQGAARGLDLRLVAELNRVAAGSTRPDITILLDLPPEVGLRRAWQRIESNGPGAADCRFENEALAFHGRVRQGYLDIAAREPERFLVIDADREEEAIRADLLAKLERRLDQSGINTSIKEP